MAIHGQKHPDETPSPGRDLDRVPVDRWLHESGLHQGRGRLTKDVGRGLACGFEAIEKSSAVRPAHAFPARKSGKHSAPVYVEDLHSLPPDTASSEPSSAKKIWYS
jgi:hypothetical protein